MPGKKTKRPRVLVTAGPTREWLDPVRFISNPSTGVMGYEIARASARAGMKVTLLSGPVLIPVPSGVRMLPFETTKELDRLLRREFPKHDLLFMTAAVGDYAPLPAKRQKIKRRSILKVIFRETPDLLAGISRLKKRQTVVGFCLETENLIINAKKKLRKKKLDFIVGNYLGNGTQPFGSGKTNVVLLGKDGSVKWFRNTGKKQLASKLIKEIQHAQSK